MKRIIVVGIFIVAIIAIFTFFLKNDYKTPILGNTIINKSNEQIKEYILNMDSYQADALITIKSNKTDNSYLVKQEASNESCKQEIIEPEKLKGIKFQHENEKLKIENSKLNITKLYENYPYIQNNVLFLTSFIKQFNENTNKKEYENEKEIILEIDNYENKYSIKQKLYIDKKTAKPIKLEVQDITQNIIVYILYNEIRIQ